MKKLILLFLGLILISCGGGGDEDVTPVQVTPEPVVVQKFTLTVSAAEGGSVNTSGGSFTSGASVNLTATAQNGYVFSGWSGDFTSNENSISITVNSDISISATFELFLLSCNTPFYPEKPSPDYSENNYEYYSYGWQTNQGISKICLNSYAGVSEESIFLINEVLTSASNRLGQLLPINITAYYNGISDLDLVMNNWDALKMTNGGFDPGDYTAAAGVDIENIHNGGQGELAQGIYENLVSGRKTIYHEFFHIYQNSHKLYFEETNNFGWNYSRITEGRDDLDFVGLVGPVWIEEGGAEFAGISLSAQNNWIDSNQAFIDYLDEARNVIIDAASRNDIVSLKDYENGKNIGRLESTNNPTGVSRQFAYQYSAGSLAHLYLLRTQRSSLVDMVENYYIDLAELERENIGEGYVYSFEKSFGISLEEFYLEFDEFMLGTRDEQLTILELN